MAITSLEKKAKRLIKQRERLIKAMRKDVAELREMLKLDKPDHSCPKCGHWMITSYEHPSRYCTQCGNGF